MENSASFLPVLCCTLLTFVASIDSNEKPPWTPQLGTLSHPRDITQYPLVVKGRVFKHNGRLFRAKVSGLAEDNMNAFKFPDEGVAENVVWREIRRGSFTLPWDLSNEDSIIPGDIYNDGREYYRGTCQETPPTNQEDRYSSSCWLQPISVKSEWMTLLREEIGDKRLGDIVIPASHDSGTWGINVNSTLVDKNFLFQLGELLTPETMVNWSITQDVEFDTQLNDGFRDLDLRITDLEEEEENGTFHWWHGLAGDPIFDGLKQLVEFAMDHPEEVLIYTFGHFRAPGGGPAGGTKPIREERLDELSDILLSYLGDVMVSETGYSNNPTINEVLESGRNVIAIMGDSYIRDKDDRYWSSIIHNQWSGRTNPEDLFEERSNKAKTYRENYADRLTTLSGCTTPDEKTITASLLKVYGEVDWVMDIIEIIAPGLVDIDPDLMSFEGVFVDLVSKARYGTNSGGMWVRPEDLYTNGGSVHYRGNADMVRYWVSRPSIYKSNIFGTDDCATSELVDVAIEAAMGEYTREVRVAHQGNPKDGYYRWEDFQAIGGDEALNCTAVQARYSATSHLYQLDEDYTELPSKTEISFQEGEYPQDAVFTLEASVEEGDWEEVFSSNLNMMIMSHLDLYLRGTDLGEGEGFAYVSEDYDEFGESCDEPPSSERQRRTLFRLVSL